MSQAVDNVALLPAYLAAATAVLVLLADLLLARCGVTLAVAVGGATATAVAATASAAGPPRGTFCVRPADDGAAMAPTVETACSYVADGRAALVAVVVALLTAAVLALSAPMLRAGAVPAGGDCLFLAPPLTRGGGSVPYNNLTLPPQRVT
ncbi:MAG: hypothetical protein DIU79_10310 [Actinobacteria bacterium]|nr:MAG: hypothetical protein DIU79_10310 [Actinomycetota bacterium]